MSGPARNVVVYGSGGHGKVVADIVAHLPSLHLLGFLDDGRPVGSEIFGLRVLGGFDWLSSPEARGAAVVFGIGDNAVRRRLFERCRAANIDILSAIHPSATIAASARIGEGTVVMAQAVLNPDAIVGLGAIINTAAVVEHDCVVGDFAHLSPNSALGGAAKVGRLSHLGLGACVLPGVAVGEESVVGAGAVVHCPVPDRVVVAGVPARLLRSLPS